MDLLENIGSAAGWFVAGGVGAFVALKARQGKKVAKEWKDVYDVAQELASKGEELSDDARRLVNEVREAWGVTKAWFKVE